MKGGVSSSIRAALACSVFAGMVQAATLKEEAKQTKQRAAAHAEAQRAAGADELQRVLERVQAAVDEGSKGLRRLQAGQGA
jgi:hypothetical protein